MDKSSRTIIGVGLGVIYVILVFFGAILVFPSQDKNLTRPSYPKTEYPKTPNCTRYNSRNSYSSLDNSYCEKLWDDYESDKGEYDKRHEEEVAKYDEQLKVYNQKLNEVIILRAFLILTIALATVIVAYNIRHIWELAGGLVVASGLLASGSVITLASNIDQTTYDKAINIIILISFVIMTALLKMIERTVFHVEVPPSSNPTGKDDQKSTQTADQAPEIVQNSPVEKTPVELVDENKSPDNSQQSDNISTQSTPQSQENHIQEEKTNQNQ